MNRWLPACLCAFAFSAFSSHELCAHSPNSACFHTSYAARDTIGPVIVCPSDTVLFLAKGACDAEYVYEVFAFDGVDSLTATQLRGLPSGAAFPPGLTQNVFTASNAAGYSVNCAFTVHVKPAPEPLECPEKIVIYLGPQCIAAPRGEELLSDGYYTCPDKLGTSILGLPATRVPAIFDAEDLGKTFSLAVRDSLIGAECLTQVEDVRDTVPPRLLCPTVEVPCIVPVEQLTPLFLRDSLGLTSSYPALFEGCPGDLSILFTDVRRDYPCDSVGVAGVIQRFWTVVDAHGNFATCVQVIKRMRTVQEVQLPKDTTLSCTSSRSPDVLGWPYFQVGTRQYPLRTNATCGLAVEYADSEQSLCGSSRLLTRLWTVRDTCRLNDLNAEPFVGEQVVELADRQGPSVVCSPIVGATLLDTGCVGTIDLPDFVVIDLCSPVVRAVLQWTATDSLVAELTDFAGADTLRFDTLATFGQLANLTTGPLPMTLLLYDACGNVSTCAFALDVRDQQPPIALCDSLITVYLDDNGQASIPAESLDDGSSDDCRPVHFKVRLSSLSNCDTLQRWDDSLRVCCFDAGAPLVATLRVYDATVPHGPVPDSLGSGHYSQCQSRIEIVNHLPPSCQAPADVTIDCANFDPSLKSYGRAIPSCGVDSLVEVLDTTNFSWNCGSGTLLRIFQVFDRQGNSAQCTQQITAEADFTYFVKFPNDLIVSDCSSLLNEAPIVTGFGCEDVVIEYTDERRSSFSTCYDIVRKWKVYNRCTHDPNQPLVVVPNPQPNPIREHINNRQGPLVSAPNAPAGFTSTKIAVQPGHIPTDYSTFYNPDGNGYSYEQYIWVVDQTSPSIVCSPETYVFPDVTWDNKDLWVFKNLDLCEAEAKISISAIDDCEGSDLVVQWRLFLDLDGNQTVETVLASYEAVSPGIVLYNNIHQPNYSGGTPVVFDHRSKPSMDKYRFDIHRHKDGDTLRVQLVWREGGQPGFVLPKLPRGIHRIEWVVEDRCGNETTCTQTIQVGNPPYLCAPAEETITGHIRTEAGERVPGVIVELTGSSPLQNPITEYDVTNSNGEFSILIPFASTFTVQPFYEENPVKGVTTLDLLLINRHILNLEPLPTPYRIIAADANSSRTVTTFDLLELRKLILGLYTELPNSPSWRFVPVSYVFPNPANPFSPPFPEKIHSSDSILFNFIIIKVGDANGSAKFSLQNEYLGERQLLYLEAEDQWLNAGEEVVVALRANEEVAGIQGTLEGLGLELVEVLPEGSLAPEHYAVFDKGRRLTFSWDGGGKPVLRLRLRALRSGRLSESLALSDALTPAEAYRAYDLGQSLGLRLRFSNLLDSSVEAIPGISSWPNPFKETVWMYVHLPREGRAVFSVRDAAGRLLWEKTGVFEAGVQSIRLGFHELGNASGVLYFAVETSTGRAVHRLVRF
ncbi:MAG: HYR domain-containing protein [Saprospiraceae bacterium]|nr:HYR domain-containing protein [Saprospiraceae bacterium]MDW8484094.1 HYR domain-containing protein [Saprospiraceae bacterium]